MFETNTIKSFSLNDLTAEQRQQVLAIHEKYKNGPDFEDDWLTLSPELDLNIWKTDGEVEGNIYPVVTGVVQTHVWVKLSEVLKTV